MLVNPFAPIVKALMGFRDLPEEGDRFWPAAKPRDRFGWYCLLAGAIRDHGDDAVAWVKWRHGEKPAGRLWDQLWDTATLCNEKKVGHYLRLCGKPAVGVNEGKLRNRIPMLMAMCSKYGKQFEKRRDKWETHLTETAGAQ